MAVRTWSVTANPTEYSTLRPRLASWAVSQSSSPCEAPAPSARTSSLLRWAAGTCAIAAVRTAMWSAGGVGAGVPGPQRRGEHLLGVVAPHPDRVVPEPALERGRRRLLLRVRRHQGGVHVEDHRVAEVGAGDLRGRQRRHLRRAAPTRAGGPWRGPSRPASSPRGSARPGSATPSARDATGPSTWRLVAQHVDVGDGLTTVGQQHRQVDQHPAPVMDRAERAPRQRRRQGSRSARPGRPAAAPPPTRRAPPPRSRRR